MTNGPASQFKSPSSKKPPPGDKRTQARYDVQEQLASGGMGVVYRVFDRAAGEMRAMKRASLDVAHQRFALDAFEREYHVLASLDHPRIIRVYDYGVDDLGPYFTMELLEGDDLRKAAPLPYKIACLYLRDVATSLSLLHARHLIHRDLSPSNIRTTKEGHCKLFDFGALAPFGQTPVVVGTPPSIPPEALNRAPLDQRADLYSLGALAYWLLTGRHAYPTRHIEKLRDKWAEAPAPPSSFAPDIPRALDALVLSLLCADPLARPGSAAEVIARLDVIGDLPPESTTQAERLAESFLLSPRFAGRSLILTEIGGLTEAAMGGRGSAVCIQSVPGMGRTRLLDEVGVRARLQGATVIRSDASVHRQPRGTTRSLVMGLCEAAPELAREYGGRFRSATALLGPEFSGWFDSVPPATAGVSFIQINPRANTISNLEEWFTEISKGKPLVILVDNVEYADDASLGLLASLANLSTEHAILIVATERLTRESLPPLGLTALQSYARTIELGGLSSSEMFELVRSLFGDAPNIKRFSEWLQERTAGSPLHAVEICRQLAAKQVIRYSDGIWTLPMERPDAELSPALGDALSMHLAGLSEPARALAECLSLQREPPTLELCRLLSHGSDERQVLHILDELARNDVLYPERDGYRFSSTALREALLRGMDETRLKQNHRRLGEAFTKLTSNRDRALQLQAGWHLIRGGDEVRGADIIADVVRDPVTVRTLTVNLYRAGEPIEAALKVYGRYRRSLYERMPLLAALAHAAYYEDRSWSERYGDQALDVLEDLSGLATARRFRPFLGRWLSLGLGILIAFIRFQCTPRRERRYSFYKVFDQLFGAVTALTGVASLSLDIERAARVTHVIEPFTILPERTTPVGIYQFCRGLQDAGGEHEATCYDTFDKLLRRFEDRRCYKLLPDDARGFYIAGAHFARASFAIFRAHGETTLQSADALDATGLKLYAMIASQLRFLYYTIRGEFTKAIPHREQLELHAAHVGSVWQVETWGAAALTVIFTNCLSDIVGATRIAHRLNLLSRTVPSLKLQSHLADRLLLLTRGETRYTDMVAAEYAAVPPRSFVGWAATMGNLGRSYNQAGKHAEAKAICERTLTQLTEADREYVPLFLLIDIELAIADASLGQPAVGLARLDGLLKRFADCDHPIAHGLLHEARARICWNAGMSEEYARSTAEVERWFHPTGTPALIAKCKRLAQLATASASAAAQSNGTSKAPDGSVDPDELLTVESGSVETANTSQDMRLPPRRPTPKKLV